MCAEFLPREEEEEMPALLYITLCHLPRRRDTAVEKKSFYSFLCIGGPDPSQKQWGSVNKLAVNRAIGSAVAGDLQAGAWRIEW